jgi:hypothetical protein
LRRVEIEVEIAEKKDEQAQRKAAKAERDLAELVKTREN